MTLRCIPWLNTVYIIGVAGLDFQGSSAEIGFAETGSNSQNLGSIRVLFVPNMKLLFSLNPGKFHTLPQMICNSMEFKLFLYISYYTGYPN